MRTNFSASVLAAFVNWCAHRPDESLVPLQALLVLCDGHIGQASLSGARLSSLILQDFIAKCLDVDPKARWLCGDMCAYLSENKETLCAELARCVLW
jgi:hypothetical protein